MKARATLLFLPVLIFLNACDLINPSEQLPAYVHIDSISFEAIPSMGSSSHKITEVWVYDNGTMLGAYDLPADVPILLEGNNELSFFAGIKNNGMSSHRIQYPFYEGYYTNVNLSPLKTDTVRPSFTYKENTSVLFEAYFEDASTGFTSTVINDNVEFVVSEDADNIFEGNGSGNAIFGDDESLFQVESSIDNLFLPAGEKIWLEMDYKCNNSFAVGMFSYVGDDRNKDNALIMSPTTNEEGIDEWNKIYIELTHIVQSNSNAQDYQLYLESIPDDGVTLPDLWVDNLKIVAFD